jgi:hypothetical protein
MWNQLVEVGEHEERTKQHPHTKFTSLVFQDAHFSDDLCLCFDFCMRRAAICFLVTAFGGVGITREGLFCWYELPTIRPRQNNNMPRSTQLEARPTPHSLTAFLALMLRQPTLRYQISMWAATPHPYSTRICAFIMHTICTWVLNIHHGERVNGLHLGMRSINTIHLVLMDRVFYILKEVE